MTIKDNKETYKPINYEGISLDANMSVSPFGQNKAAEIAYKKAERLVLATHLVTNFVPQSESVRENCRDAAQQLLPMVMNLRDGFQSTGTDTVVGITAHVRQLLSLLDIVHASGYISDMNLEVLKHAYANLVRFLHKSQEGSASESLELGEADFLSPSSAGVSTQNSNGHKARILKDTNIKDTIKDTEFIKDIKEQTNNRSQSLRAKRRVTSRRMSILDVITKRNPIHIKDIATEISGCSEKTIQRELQSLVNDKVVKKEGSKRWTTYSLVV